MLWAAFSLLAAICAAASNIFDRFILTKRVRNPFVPLVAMGLVNIIIGIFVYVFHGFSSLSAQDTLLSIIAGAAFTYSIIFYFKAVKVEEVSRVVPLANMTIIFVLLLAAVFLGEFFAPVTYLGILLLLLGALLISLKSRTGIRSGKALLFMAVYSFLWSVNIVITKYLLNFSDFWTVFSYVRGMGFAVALVPIAGLNFRGIRAEFGNGGRKLAGLLMLNESIRAGGVLFFILAAAKGPITLVNALASVQPFFVLIFAVLLAAFYPALIKEETGRAAVLLKLAAIILMFAGAVLIS